VIDMGSWLRRTFIAGFFVTVPLGLSVAALFWIFGVVDGLTVPFTRQLLGRQIPGLGLVITAMLVLAVGAVTTNVIGRRVVSRTEEILMRVPVFRAIYAPIRQLIVAFSPNAAAGFKRVVMVEDPRRGLVMGFLTREFSVDRGHGSEKFVAVYVPTNHLYLGDVAIYPRGQALFPEITVKEGIQIFLTGGMSLPEVLKGAGRNRPGSDYETK
tara:strand:- start:1442 stop:2077 length:636 start_codon:yes stop_codon:yes gene_type:complete